MKLILSILGLLSVFAVNAQTVDVKSMQIRGSSKSNTVKYRDVHHRQVRQKLTAKQGTKQMVLQPKDFNEMAIRPNSKDYSPSFRPPVQRGPMRRLNAIDNTKRLQIQNTTDFQRKQQMVKQRNRTVMQKHMHDQQMFQRKRQVQQQMIRRKIMQRQLQQQRNTQRKRMGH